MQRNLEQKRVSEEEIVKQAGLVLDFDEIARAGSMSKEEVLIAKWYGIYRSRDPKTHMARVVVPGGKLTSVQIRAIAGLSEKYSQGLISFTTRQAAQFHRLGVTTLSGLLRDVAVNGLTTFHGCGDVTRNITACPWASICRYRRFDVLPYAQETSRLLSASRDLDNMPRKYKLTFSGCGANCAQPYINCLGAIAVSREMPDGGRQDGFKVVIGGGMGWKPFVAQELYSFVPADSIAQLSYAIALLFNEHGDRFIRKYSRLKFVVHRKGIQECRRLLTEILDRRDIDHSEFFVEPTIDIGIDVPPRPLRDPNPIDENGLAIQRIMIPKGEISAKHLTLIADCSEKYADKHVYSTNRQNIELHGIQPEHIEELRADLKPTGLLTQGFYGLRDIVSCVGKTYCPLAVSTTHSVFDQLQDIVHREKYESIQDKVLINITGCPNSCSPYRIADIGMRGMRIREAHGSAEGYQMILGGTQQQFGQIIGEFKEADALRVIETILDTFLEYCNGRSHGTASLAEHVRKEGIGPYQKAIDVLNIHYEMTTAPNELSTFTGEGQTVLDFTTIAKDIPCQDACPAGTNIPQYIRLISQGQFEQAHLINQNDNVLPGTLGRICTRPCEGRCRHQWTNTLGPVSICHLKRSAADHKPEKSQPLPMYYPPTGKKTAIIGGGPAGLAGARELKRYGHDVVIYERESYLGGQVRTGIPQFRLPRDILSEDIAAIIHSGVEVKYNQVIDGRVIEELTRDYDAVMVAAGANEPYRLELEGITDTERVSIEGLHFMKAYNDDAPIGIGERVIVIGGGFTAVDCARSARRLSPTAKITIVYRRGEAQMAATKDELHELAQENILVATLMTPTKAILENGGLKAVGFQRNILGAPDASGKPRFIPVEGSEVENPCDTLIIAIGQRPQSGILPVGVSLTGSHGTSQEGLFVSGDFASGNGDVIHAVADGKEAAAAIDTFLMAQKRNRPTVSIDVLEETGRIRDHDLIAPPVMPVSDTRQRDKTTEVELGFDPEMARQHAKRCYLCNYKFEIDQDKCIYCDWCIRVSPRECIRRLSDLQRDKDGVVTGYTEVAKSQEGDISYIWIDSDNCIRCGNCYNICPTEAISLRAVNQKTECAGGGVGGCNPKK
ncbi:MAG: FAD-dependent oxidoreductase [Phycisphaerae bacterium]|nr:FAD-dependent oxidoreductase [Phycisphaerae bacterium]